MELNERLENILKNIDIKDEETFFIVRANEGILFVYVSQDEKKDKGYVIKTLSYSDEFGRVIHTTEQHFNLNEENLSKHMNKYIMNHMWGE